MRHSKAFIGALALGVAVTAWGADARAAGTLTPTGTGYLPIETASQAVRVVINNGFARTEVTEVFHNPNGATLAAVYAFPVPPNAALSEMSITVNEQVLHGEVVAADQAQAIYEEEASAGNEAGLATQDSYQHFTFSVSAVPGDGDATMHFVYYEPVNIDTGFGRYLYPLKNGGTDETSFWTGEDTAAGKFSFDLDLRSAAPVSEMRVPDVPSATITALDPGHYQVHFDATPGTLGEDVVAYYRLTDGLAGRVDLVPYRASDAGDGTFMLLVTPGIDLAPCDHGTDYVFVLDFSGSMETKLATLKEAIADVLQELGPEDRFRLVGFSDGAFGITGGFLSTSPEDVAAALAGLDSERTRGGTNLYAGLTAGLADNDSERVTSVFLVTDGVANEGVIEPLEFDRTLRESDERVYGFLLGNSANWPLMAVITDASGGFYAPVSNREDVVGQVLLAQGKLGHESLYDAKLAISGVPVSDTTDFELGKVFYGDQLVVFGRYQQAGAATLDLHTRVRNQDKTYSATLAFPDVAEDSPELERLWALAMIHATQKQAILGLIPAEQARARVTELGIDYQLVTDETSMLVLDDAGFVAHGVARNNQVRTDTEHAAQAGSGAPAGSGQSSASSGYEQGGPASTGGHGGALDPLSIALLGWSLVGFGALPNRRRRA